MSNRESKTAETLNPPAEHSDKQWHWARHDGDDKWFVFEARRGLMWNGPGNMSGAYAYSVGWRYAGPAIPPGAPPKERLTKAEKIADMSDADWERHVRRVGTQGNQPRPV
jgi:hypothetical protein